MYDMYLGYRYFIYEFLFMCLFIYFIVYWGYFKFVYEFMIRMYLVMDHMHWICYVFEHSSSIWSVNGRIIRLCYVILFIYLFFPADNCIYSFVCSYIREMKIQVEKEDRHMSTWGGLWCGQDRDDGGGADDGSIAAIALALPEISLLMRWMVGLLQRLFDCDLN